MPRIAASLLALALGAVVALALASCGGSDAKLLPGETAQQISENLDTVQRLVDEHECIDAEDAALEVSTEVEALEDIDPKLKQTLERGAERLNVVVETCVEMPEDTIEVETSPETTETTEGGPEKKEKKEKKPKKVEPEEGETEEAKPPKTQAEPTTPVEEVEEPAPPAEEGPSGGIGPGSAAEEGG